MSTFPSASNHEELLAHVGWIRELARKLVGDRHLAEDLAQATCVVALERHPRDRSRLRQWLATILRNFARQEARSSRSRARRERMAGSGEVAPSALDTLERASIQHELVTAVLKLNEAHRTAILMRFFDGLPQREIARRTNTTVATVNSRLTRALEQLRRDLDRSHGSRQAWSLALLPVLKRPVSLATPTLGILVMNKLKLTAIGLCAAGVVAALLGLFDADNPGSTEPPPRATSQAPALSSGASRDAARPGNTTPQREVLRPSPATAAAPGTRLLAQGQVLFADGSPAPGVLLGMEDAGPSAPTATSDPMGRFSLEVESGGDIVAASPEHATVLAGAYSPGSTIEPTVVIAPAISLAGVVSDEDGEPLSSTHLRLNLPDDFAMRFSANLERSKRQRWESISDGDGTFSLEGVPMIGGSYLRATLEPYVPEVVGTPRYSDDRIYIVLHDARPEGELLRGRVVDQGGSVVPEARVAMGLTSSITDANGEFEIERRRTGEADRIVAVKEGFIPGQYEPRKGGGGEPEWPPFVELRLGGEALVISGQVLDLDGEPVENALVWALDTTPFGNIPVQLEFLSAGGIVPPGEVLELPVIEDDAPAPVSNNMNHAKDPSAFWYYETTDSHGRFTLPGLMPGTYRLRAMHPESILTATSDPIAAGTSVTIRMPEGATHPVVSGRILTEEGHAIEGISILQVCEVYGARYRVPDALVDQKLIRHGPRTETDAEGRFTFHDVPRERVHLSIYGDAILPLIAELSTLGDPTNLHITVTARYHFEVILDNPTSADTVMARNAAGDDIPVSVLRSGSYNSRSDVPLQNGRSGVLAVSGQMHTAVLLKNGEVVAEVPVTLVPGQTAVIRR